MEREKRGNQRTEGKKITNGRGKKERKTRKKSKVMKRREGGD